MYRSNWKTMQHKCVLEKSVICPLWNSRRQGGAAVRYQDGESSPTGGGTSVWPRQVCRQLADVASLHVNFYRYELWEKLAKKPRTCLRLLGPWEGGR
ncbi:hypothetical protein CEXT_136451 [Caerostris extrusa]|uniref:Uncharacterized protein n=1 Tax=Caerostris extrusa TaxID=172846 RepID=A0AAV4U2C5_CAEEX|nr:hypothetical protein CEXT_136451 [Caerostris extrusa]